MRKNSTHATSQLPTELLLMVQKSSVNRVELKVVEIPLFTGYILHPNGGWEFVYFHPYLGKWSNLTNIFQMGLKPPTRNRRGNKKTWSNWKQLKDSFWDIPSMELRYPTSKKAGKSYSSKVPFLGGYVLVPRRVHFGKKNIDKLGFHQTLICFVGFS